MYTLACTTADSACKLPGPSVVARAEMVTRHTGRFLAAKRLNVATYCAPVSGIYASQQRNGQVADTRDTVYGSDSDYQSHDLRSALHLVLCPFTGSDLRSCVGIRST